MSVSLTPVKASNNRRNSGESQHSHSLHDSMHLRESSGLSYLPQNCKSSRNGSQMRKFPPQSSNVQYCTLESFSAIANQTHLSLSKTSFSSASESQGSHQDSHSDNNSESPVSASCLTEDPTDLKDKLKQLESVMLGPEVDKVASFDALKLLMEIPNGDLKQILTACARAIGENNFTAAEWLISELRQMVSVSGEPIERLGAYLLEGLVARLASSGSSIYKALKCKEPASPDLLSYMHILYEICPYFKFGYMSANGAIAEAMKNEEKVHIIDFQIAQGSQWVTLIQAMAARPGGPPHLKLTGIDDSFNAYARGGGLQIVGRRLSQLAESCRVPFEFRPAAMPDGELELELENLGVRSGEALAVNFAFQLHHIPDESVSTANRRDRLLRSVKRMAPKVVTLVEQESNTNTAAFFPRFVETLHYYTAIFESIDAAVPRDSKERINVEQHCLARDIVNIIACEGSERVERHEVHGKWKSRFKMAGFAPYPLSSLVNATIRSLLENYCDKFRLEEVDGALYLGWKNRALVVSSAWR